MKRELAPTPETDALECNGGANHDPWILCRTMERQRDQWKQCHFDVCEQVTQSEERLAKCQEQLANTARELIKQNTIAYGRLQLLDGQEARHKATVADLERRLAEAEHELVVQKTQHTLTTLRLEGEHDRFQRKIEE